MPVLYECLEHGFFVAGPTGPVDFDDPYEQMVDESIYEHEEYHRRLADADAAASAVHAVELQSRVVGRRVIRRGGATGVDLRCRVLDGLALARVPRGGRYSRSDSADGSADGSLKVSDALGEASVLDLELAERLSDSDRVTGDGRDARSSLEVAEGALEVVGHESSPAVGRSGVAASAVVGASGVGTSGAGDPTVGVPTDIAPGSAVPGADVGGQPVEDVRAGASSTEPGRSAARAGSSVRVGYAEIGRRRLEVVGSMLAERGLPRDADGYPLPVVPRDMHEGRGEHPRREGVGSWGVELTAELLGAAGSLLQAAREVEREGLAGTYSVSRGHDLFPVYVDGGPHPDRFILSPVGQDTAPRCWPVVVPVDIVAFGLTRLGSVGERVRFFGELVRTYSEALRLGRDVPGLDAQLVRTLGVLAGFLRDALRADSKRDPDQGQDQPDNPDDVHGTSTYASDDISAPATDEEGA